MVDATCPTELASRYDVPRYVQAMGCDGLCLVDLALVIRAAGRWGPFWPGPSLNIIVTCLIAARRRLTADRSESSTTSSHILSALKRRNVSKIGLWVMSSTSPAPVVLSIVHRYLGLQFSSAKPHSPQSCPYSAPDIVVLPGLELECRTSNFPPWRRHVSKDQARLECRFNGRD